jgi:molybdopterin converting factor small subunit
LLAAYAEGLHDVNEEMIRDIIGDLDFENYYWGQERPATVSDTAVTPADVPRTSSFWSESRIEELFGKLNQRLENHEKETLAAAQAPIKELSERLAQIQDTFALQLNGTNAAVARLNSKIEEMPYNLSVTQEPAENNNVPKSGLIRRIFG